MMPPLYHRLWQWLKYQVNHEESEIPLRNGQKQKIQKGQHMTSLRQIAQGIGWYEGRKWKEPNPKTIRAVLKWMEQQGMITITAFKGNNGYTLVTVENWELYQSKLFQGNNEYPIKKQSTDINKNDNNDNNITTVADPIVEPLSEQEEAIRKVSNYWLNKQQQLHLSSNDLNHIESLIVKEKIPPDTIIEGIEKVYKRFLETNRDKPWKKINSLNYCIGKILDLHYEKTNPSQTNVTPFRRPNKKEEKLPLTVQKAQSQLTEMTEPIDPNVEAIKKALLERGVGKQIGGDT